MKQLKKISALLLAMVTVMTVFLSGCGSSGPDMKISIGDKTFELGCKVGSILDAGYVLADADDVDEIMADPGKIGKRTVIENGFYLFKNGAPAHVAIYICNMTVNEVDLKDCVVYGFKYNAGQFRANHNMTGYIKVQFNGIDMRFTDRDTVLSALESKGFKFKNDEKTNFVKSGDPSSRSYITATNSSGPVLTIFNDYNFDNGSRTVNGFQFYMRNYSISE